MINAALFTDYIRVVDPEVSVKISERWRDPDVNAMAIKKNMVGSFFAHGLAHFCGGVFLSGISIAYPSKEGHQKATEDLIELLTLFFKYCYAHHLGLVSYITVDSQSKVISILERLGFESCFYFKNPNTGNDCISWNLNLTKFVEKYGEL